MRGLSKLYVYLLLAANIILMIAGQVLWKQGASTLGRVSVSSFIHMILNPYLLLGTLFFFLATLIWFIVLAKGKFSIVFPLQSMAIPLGVVVASLVFNESVPVTRWIGIALMLGSVALVTYK